MKNSRPLNLNLFTIKFPMAAIVSILHRLSGVILFIFIPALLYLLHCSLNSETSFTNLQNNFSPSWVKLPLWLFMAAICFHFIAGIRHLLMDMQFGMTKEGSKLSAYTVILLAIVLILLSGYWLCC